MRTIPAVGIFLIILIHANAQVMVTDNGAEIPENQHSLLIAGHRGGFDSSLPENSLALFDNTLFNVCYQPLALEFDIRKSASGSLYAMHDSTVERTTEGFGPIRELTDSMINSLRLKDRNNNLTSCKVPLLSEILSYYNDKNVSMMLDVKGDIFSEVIRIVKQFQMENQCIMLTFNQDDLRFCMKSTTTMWISALITNEAMWDSVNSEGFQKERLIAHVSWQTPPELIARIRKESNNLMIGVDEINFNMSQPFESGYYRKIIRDLQPDILITDFPVFVSNLFCDQ